jgi:hypothetical protein
MRNLRPFYLILTVFVLLPIGYAQKGNWQSVESLAPGTSISIQARHRFHCKFLTASDDAISCEQSLSALRVSREFAFDRTEIKQVRVEHPTASMFLGAAIGAGAGVGYGSTGGSGTLTKAGTEFVGGALFGFLGGVVGRETHIIPGTIIYQK